MTSKQGDHYHNLITYEELDHPDRIIYTHGTGDEGDTTEFKVTLTFEKVGTKKTKVIMHMVFQTPEALAEVKKFGAVEGANQTLDKLMVHLSKEKYSAPQVNGFGVLVMMDFHWQIKTKLAFGNVHTIIPECAWN